MKPAATQTPSAGAPAAPRKRRTGITPSLLKLWGGRLAQGGAAPFPIFLAGGWRLELPRGNKRVLRLGIREEKQKH